MFNQSFVLILVICATSSHIYWFQDNGWLRRDSRLFGNRGYLFGNRETLPEVTRRGMDDGKLKKRWGYDGSADPKYVDDKLGEGTVVDDTKTVPPSDTNINDLKKGINARNYKNEKKIKNYRKFRESQSYDYEEEDDRYNYY